MVGFVGEIADMLGGVATDESVLAASLDEEDDDQNHYDEQTHNCDQPEVECQVRI